jgi:hypothetical protein
MTWPSRRYYEIKQVLGMNKANYEEAKAKRSERQRSSLLSPNTTVTVD